MFNPENTVVRAIVSGWQISGITRFATGTPLGPFTANCNVPQAGTCWASYNPTFTGPVRINGIGAMATGAVANATPLSTSMRLCLRRRSLTATRRRQAPTASQPAFLQSGLEPFAEFPVRENLRLVFGVDSFNVFNSVRFGSINTNITNANFGKAQRRSICRAYSSSS